MPVGAAARRYRGDQEGVLHSHCKIAIQLAVSMKGVAWYLCHGSVIAWQCCICCLSCRSAAAAMAPAAAAAAAAAAGTSLREAMHIGYRLCKHTSTTVFSP
jgi:hypothetical protein